MAASQRALDCVEVGRTVRFSDTVGEHDVYAFAGITGDLSPNHVDEEYMKGTPYGHLKRLMNEGRTEENQWERRFHALAHRLGHPLMGERDRRISLLERLVKHAEATARFIVY